MPAFSSGRGAHRSPLLKAFAAVNRATLRRFEGDRGLLPTLRTGRLGFASLESVSLTCTIRALRLAPLAPLGLVLEALVGEKHLFAGGEDELGTTFSALQNPILVLHRLLRDPTLVGGSSTLARLQPDRAKFFAWRTPPAGRCEAASENPRARLLN